MGSTASARNGTWRNWGGNVSVRPARETAPASVDELAAAVRRAAEDGLPVKAVGTGHSFTSMTLTFHSARRSQDALMSQTCSIGALMCSLTRA